MSLSSRTYRSFDHDRGRHNAVLREIDRRRTPFAQALRVMVQKVDAKFETVEPKSHNERIRSIVIASALKKESSLQDRSLRWCCTRACLGIGYM